MTTEELLAERERLIAALAEVEAELLLRGEGFELQYEEYLYLNQCEARESWDEH